MSLFTRLSSYFNKRGAPLPIARQQEQEGFLIRLDLANLDLHPVKDVSDQLDSYVGWVYACVSKIAQDHRTNPWAVWRRTGKNRQDWQMLEDGQLPNLFFRPNDKPGQNTWGQFRELRDIHKDLTGMAYWHLLTDEPGGRIFGIELIQPDHVEEPVYSNDFMRIEGWRVVPGGTGIPRTIDARDIILDFYPNPKDNTRGASPVEAFGLAHHFDIYTRAYGVKSIRDGAHIGQYISSDQDLTDDQIEAIEGKLQRKFRTPGRFGVFGKGASVHGMQMPLGDLNMLRLLKPSMDIILAVYGMPKSKLGMMEGEGRANAETADRNYSENTLLPRFSTFSEIVNSLRPRIFGRTGVNLWYEEESPVNVDRDFLLESGTKKLIAGAVKVNDFLLEQGADDIGEDGDVFLLPSSSRPVRSLAKEADRLEAEAQQTITNSVMDQAAAKIAKIKRAADVWKLRATRAVARFESRQDELERITKSKLRSLFSREQKKVAEALRDNFDQIRSMSIEYWEERDEDVVDMALEGYVDDGKLRIPIFAETRDWINDSVEEFNEDWNALMFDTIDKGVRTGWTLLQEEVAASLSFEVYEQKARDFARQVSGDKVVQITNTTKEGIQLITAQVIEEGLDVAEAQRRLSALYDGFRGPRSATIARTETANAINFGKHASARESARRLNMNIVRSWLSTPDDQRRESHRDADANNNSRNRDVPMGETYEVGGVAMFHPGDIGAPARETINCRCTETYRDVDA